MIEICKNCDHFLVCKYAEKGREECSQFKPYNADTVTVIRCKDCRHYTVENMPLWVGWCECTQQGVYSDHFCGYGERKNDG